MKKILIGCAVAIILSVMMFTPTASKADSDWVGPLVAGTIFGVIIGKSSHGHGHTEVIIESHRPSHHHHHRQHQRRRHGHEYVEVCKSWPYLKQDHHGDYYTVMRDECRIVKRAVW